MDSLGLKAVDGFALPERLRAALRPGEPLVANDGGVHHLPRFFYEIGSWAEAHDVRLTPHFRLWELMFVDSREDAALLREFPHYVPCAITALARLLEALRTEAGAAVFVSANGGYRSPAHQLSRGNDLHQWGTAANIYRIGDTYLDNEKTIDRFARMATALGADLFVRPYAAGDDHLHLDLGYLAVTPREFTEARP